MSETTTTTDPIDAAVAAGLEETNLRATPLPATAVDAAGTERVVSYPKPWTPAPVEPDPKIVERMKAFEAVAEKQAEQRQQLLKTGTVAPEVPAEAAHDAADPSADAAQRAQADAEAAQREQEAEAERQRQAQAEAAAEAERQRLAQQQAAQQRQQGGA